jgi:hypothetical protein
LRALRLGEIKGFQYESTAFDIAFRYPDVRG